MCSSLQREGVASALGGALLVSGRFTLHSTVGRVQRATATCD